MDFELLQRTYEGDLRRVARFLTGNAHDADDLVQEVWRKVVSTSQGPEQGKEKAWLLRVLHNSWHDRWRRSKNNPVRNNTDLSSEDPDTTTALDQAAVSTEASGPQKLEQSERVSALQECMQRIQEEYRSLLIRTFFKLQTYTQISAELAMPVGTIASRMNRGKSMIKDCMEAKGW